MEREYPFDYTLEDGTAVTVNHAGNQLYEFILKPDRGETRRFTYDNSEEFTEAKEAELDFDQLNALRRFWLLTRDEAV